MDATTAAADTRRVHYLGTPFASRAACGRTILAHRDDAPAHTDNPAAVTCRACQKATR